MDAVPHYQYHDAKPTHANAYLWPILEKLVKDRWSTPTNGARAFDLGCGNGATSDFLSKLGFDVVGVDMSESGIEFARQAFPSCRFDVASAYDDLAGNYGQFDLVVSLEVVEHLYDPRKFAARVFDLLKPGAPCMISTPYHGYLKNVALAVSGNLDKHFTALWDGGHIKFWSIDTLGKLLAEVGFQDIKFERAGRFPALAKSMLAIGTKPL